MGDYCPVEVSLRGARPRICQRFKFSTEAMTLDLHEAIQDACGWKICNLFKF